TLWNRDTNAARNIRRLLEEFHRSEDRDRYEGAVRRSYFGNKSDA
ncbi:14245_t:CDS:1, partial [Racocetra fulgida]